MVPCTSSLDVMHGLHSLSVQNTTWHIHGNSAHQMQHRRLLAACLIYRCANTPLLPGAHYHQPCWHRSPPAAVPGCLPLHCNAANQLHQGDHMHIPLLHAQLVVLSTLQHARQQVHAAMLTGGSLVPAMSAALPGGSTSGLVVLKPGMPPQCASAPTQHQGCGHGRSVPKY